MTDTFKLIKKLTQAHGVSGREGSVSELIESQIEPHTDSVYSDAMGNLIAHKEGKGKKIMFSAHMDSIGFIATHIDESGFVRFAAVGGLRPEAILCAPVAFSNGARGVIARDGKTDKKDPKIDSYYIDIGASGKEQALTQVSPGDTAAYCGESFLAGGNVVSPYLDNRAGCAALILAISRIKDSPNDLYFVFSSQEEVGLRGAKTAAFSIDPDYGIAVDVTTAGDVPEYSPKNDCRLGGGAAVKIMDSSVLCNPKVVKMLEETAKDEGIPYQREILIRGGTDAGAINTARAGVYTGAVSIPARYIHSPFETADVNDIESCARLISAFALRKMD